MNLAWIAAILQPRDVAKHPNFPDEGLLGEPSAELASLVIGGAWSLRTQTVAGDRWEQVRELLGKALVADTQTHATNGIADMLRRDPGPIAEDAALTLFVSASGIELERYDLCVGLVEQQARRVGNPRTHDEMLISAALSQQLALRSRDFGMPFENHALRVGSILEKFRATKATPFVTSESTVRDYAGTLSDIATSLRHAAAQLFSFDTGPADLGPLPSRFELFREGPSPADRKYDSHAEFALRSAVERDFRERNGGRSPHVDEANVDTFRALLVPELLGSPLVYRARETLALERARDSSGEWSKADALRLLRQAGSKENLELLIRGIKASGPLNALATDARRIIGNRCDIPASMRPGELLVLEESADLLSRTEAHIAFRAVIGVLAQDNLSDSPGTRQIDVMKRENAWRCLSSLARVSGEADLAIRTMLDGARSYGTPDGVLDRALSAAVRKIDWRQVSNELQSAFKSFVGAYREELGSTLDAAQPIFGSRDGVAGTGLDGLRAKVNLALRATADRVGIIGGYEVRFTEDEDQAIVEAVEDFLAASENGRFNFGSFDLLDLAAAYAMLRSDPTIWRTLFKALTSPRVPQHLKNLALDRMAFGQLVLPEGLLKGLSLTDFSGPSLGRMFNERLESGKPYAQALRFAITCGMVSPQDALPMILELLTGSEFRTRVQGARTLALTARTAPLVDIFPVAVYGTYQPDALVRAHCGIAVLSLLDIAPPGTRSLGESCVARLLEEDGYVVPIAVLDELLNPALLAVTRNLRSSLTSVLERLATDHVAGEVRERALRVMQLAVDNPQG
ncbi:hypothetical protein [Cellulosimicrobium cellulans]|uniref:hypothetical protein n=1 Tax=Cellulosimicrobium cellulans TaxID=1710 RepID=UPI0024068972|nr:hypothetical protein [Cellulosimicrobium cellulans]MDF9878579.1 hypothetical protein [Cellulosimicrobium cellulans]